MMERDPIYSIKQVEEAVSSDSMNNYDNRVIDEILSQIGIDNLIQCPDCGFLCQLEESVLIFNCLNCLSVMCMHCFKTIIDEEWDWHLQEECIGKELAQAKNNSEYFPEIDNWDSRRTNLTSSEKLPFVSEMKDLIYFESPAAVTRTYMEQMHEVIYRDFPMMNKKDLILIMRKCNFNYIKTYSCILTGLHSSGLSMTYNGDIFELSSGGNAIAITIPSTYHMESDNVVFINIMKKEYTFSHLEEDEMEPRLRKEIDLIKNFNSKENKDYTVMCDICCCDCQSSMMISCTVGHEVCRECFSNYLNQSIFALGKIELKCMMECDAIYSRKQVVKAVSSDIMNNYDKRVIDESLSQAGIDNLIQCPDCSFLCQLEESALIFNCLNCLKLMCKHCFKTIIDVEWDWHIQEECIGKELDEAKNNRTTFEERMTAIMIRTCPNCKAAIVKDGGCNHITCKCGTHLCYICKQQFKDVYLHFSQSSCPSQTSPDQDEQNAILELKREANRERKILFGVEDDKIIGVPTESEKQSLIT